MATNQPQNLFEWQLNYVLQKANLLQYYESFIRHGECDVHQLFQARDDQFEDIMEKVGMAKKSMHARQFKNTLIEWVKDPAKDLYVSSYVTKYEDSTVIPAEKSNTDYEMSSGIQHLKMYIHEKQTKEEEKFTTSKSDKKVLSRQQEVQQKHKNSVINDQQRQRLVHYYDDLLYNTVLDKMVLDNLISRCILMIEDREEIIKPTTQRERNKVLLDILTERPYPTFNLFKDALQESNPDNSYMQDLVGRMHCTANIEENISWQAHDIVLHEHIVKLQKNYMIFVHDVDCKTDILDYLYEKGVFNTEEKEEISNSLLTRHDSNRLLCDKLFRKGGDAYNSLLKALRHGQYEDVASDMEMTQVSDQEIQLCKIGMKKLRDRQNEKDLRLIHAKKEQLVCTHDEYIPKHIYEQFERRLEQWKAEDQMFVSTAAEKQLMKQIFTEGCITIVGNSGTGKSFLSRHVALKMMDQGYMIIPCDNPGDIRQWFKHGKNTLFIFDDVCGRYTLNQQIFNDWKQRLDHITSLLKDKCCKILSTCRQEVYRDDQFNSLFIFKRCNIDLSSQEFRLNSFETSALADMYFNVNTEKVKDLSEKYEFFPLLCSLYRKQKLQKHVSLSSFFSNPFGVFEDELDKLYLEGDDGKMKYCSLVLCVMFNNTLTEENLSVKEKEIDEVVQSLLYKCKLNKGTSVERLKKSLATLEGTFVVNERGTYTIIHDKLFDFLAKFFGDRLLPLLIDHANTGFISERFIWKTTEKIDTDIEFTIRISDNQINRYIDRLLKDWASGYVLCVFGNRNMFSHAFAEKFINCINKLDYCKQKKLACTKDLTSNDIALAGCCYNGFVDLVKWLIRRNSDINYRREDGYFPLFWASQNGHVNVVKELLQHSADVNNCSDEGESPLWKASQNGHVNVVKELLQHSADVNKCTDEGESSLWMASQEGHVYVVKELLRHSAHVNICNNEGESPLWIASQNGHLNIVKELLQLRHLADVNKSSDEGGSPLWIASLKGHIDVVKVLLQHSANVNKCLNGDVSPLLIASQNGHVNVVKELLHHSAKINKCMNDGSTPLSRASHSNRIEVVKALLQREDIDIDFCDNNERSSLFCASHQGHINVVKELLKHSADENKCDFRGLSPLIIARQNGHVDVVKELLRDSENDNSFDLDIRTGANPVREVFGEWV